MTDALRERKTKVREKVLGKYGIHAVGAKAAEDAVCIYTSDPSKLPAEQLRQIEAIAAPYKVQIVPDDQAYITEPDE